MKLLVVIVVLSTFMGVLCVRPNPSFLQYVGSYFLPGDEEATNYYLSQRIEYSWFGAYTFCKMNGMRLAQVTDLDQKSLLNIPSEVDLYNFNVDSKPGRNEFEEQGRRPFWCETKNSEKYSEEQSAYAIPQEEIEYSFKPLGSYVDHNGEISKSYHMSTKYTDPLTAIKVCQSFDMILASPQDQGEYDNLKNLLNKTTFEWQNAAIAGYRVDSGATKDGVWKDSGDKLNYTMNFGKGEPNNLKGDEWCIYMQTKDGISLNDDPCEGYKFPYICEFNHKTRKAAVQSNDNEISRFLEPLGVFVDKNDTEQGKYELFISKQMVKTSWFDAILMCKSLGLEIFSVKNLVDEQFKQLHLEERFWIGVTRTASDLACFASIDTDGNSRLRLHYDHDTTRRFICQKKSESESQAAVNEIKTTFKLFEVKK
ncbi:hypothetical protein Bhyg_09141 [Pseudolycoriella hygida]|uniref:C-type lectin domain-containing protein n=1 Tax=Pseudolycoriella hygida TaxID=35572 RepID=A0A9Q0S461_9DIPT|nr:hypothetical protein Bhyg_09141 [Pseudolycoriella hygida]